MMETLRYAAGRGLTSYEFLGTDEPWTKMWTQAVHKCISMRIYPATPAGMAALVLHSGRAVYERAAQAMRRGN